MLETPHSLLGGAIGGLTGNPVEAAPLGVASHFAGDVLPHWNPEWPFQSKSDYALAIGDFLLALALVPVFYVLFPDRPEIAVGAFCGTLPDIISAAYFVLKLRWLQPLMSFHIRIQHEVSLQTGLWPQAVVSLLSIYYLIRL